MNLYPKFKAEDTNEKFKGLNGLTKKCFGKPLNKSKCMSNWDARPLTQEQMSYAALDALVLVHIYDHIRERCSVEKVPFEHTNFKNKNI